MRVAYGYFGILEYWNIGIMEEYFQYKRDNTGKKFPGIPDKNNFVWQFLAFGNL